MDKREDAGEFYPGGKVVSTRPVATGGDVKHSDFADVEPLPERFTDEDVRTRFNQLVSAAKGASAAVAALLLGAASFGAGVTVQTAPKGQVYNDEHIVTNVVFDATGLAEVTNVYTKAETEAKIVELAPVPGDYATVSNKAMTALQSYTETDPTIPGWAKAPSKPTYTAAEVGALGIYGDQTITEAGSKEITFTFGSDGPCFKLTDSYGNTTWIRADDSVVLRSPIWLKLPAVDGTLALKSEIPSAFPYTVITNAPWLTDESDPIYCAQSNDFARAGHNHDSDYLKLSGGTLTGRLRVIADGYTMGMDGDGIEIKETQGGIVKHAGFDTDGIFTQRGSDPANFYNFPERSGSFALTADVDAATNALSTVAHTGSYNDLTGKPTIPTVPTEQIYAATTTNALQDAAILDLANDNAQTRSIVTTWENFLDGSNVVFSITNYLSGAYNLDTAKLKILELRDGAYQEVYNSRDEIMLHIDAFRTNDFRVATNQVIGAVNAAIGNKADKDWGKYTSAGGEAPANTVYMTAPNTVFAGGLEYERVAVGEGAVCVLTTRGAPVWTQGDEGTFKFQDDGGTNYFGFAKTDSYTIGADTDGITVQSGVVTLTYNIVMSGRPCVWYKSSLSSGAAWEQLNLPDGSAVSGASHVVTWEQNPPVNTQVCYINVGNTPSGFFRATVEVAGEAKFMTNMPADLTGGIMCTNTAAGAMGVIKPSYNGSTVNWTWSAQ